MFQCCSPETSHPRLLPQSPKDCSIHLCLFFCFAYRVIININFPLLFKNSVQFSCSVVSNSLWHHEPQHSQASLSIINSLSAAKPMSIESMMPSNHFILCRPLLLLPSIFPSNRVFSNESTLHVRWPKYWSFSFNISPSNEHPGLISLKWTG